MAGSGDCYIDKSFYLVFGPDARLNLVQTPFFKLAEIALLAAVVYHGLDGIRLLLVNWFKITEYRKSLFYAVLAVSVLIVIAGGIPILLFMLETS